MRNRNVGYLIIGIAVIMVILVLLFNNVISQNLGLTCSHGPTCGMYTTLRVQTWISFVIIGVIVLIGLFFIFAKENEKIVVKTKKIADEVAEKIKEEKKNNLRLLNKEEKILYQTLMKEGSMFQASLVEQTGFGKVKVTRILDRLEAKNLIERKRRGMTNIVVLK